MKGSLQLNRGTMAAALTIRGITQQELAEMTGMSKAWTSAICRGMACRPDHAQKIADALGVTVEQLQKPIVI